MICSSVESLHFSDDVFANGVGDRSSGNNTFQALCSDVDPLLFCIWLVCFETKSWLVSLTDEGMWQFQFSSIDLSTYWRKIHALVQVIEWMWMRFGYVYYLEHRRKGRQNGPDAMMGSRDWGPHQIHRQLKIKIIINKIIHSKINIYN